MSSFSKTLLGQVSPGGPPGPLTGTAGAGGLQPSYRKAWEPEDLGGPGSGTPFLEASDESLNPPGPLPVCPRALLGLHAGLPSPVWGSHTTQCPCRGPSSAPRRKKRRTGPGNRWKSEISAPNPAPTMHPSPGAPQAKEGWGPRIRRREKKGRHSNPQGLGCFVSVGEGWRGKHTWGPTTPGGPGGPVFPWKP